MSMEAPMKVQDKEEKEIGVEERRVDAAKMRLKKK